MLTDKPVAVRGSVERYLRARDESGFVGMGFPKHSSNTNNNHQPYLIQPSHSMVEILLVDSRLLWRTRSQVCTSHCW